MPTEHAAAHRIPVAAQLHRQQPATHNPHASHGAVDQLGRMVASEVLAAVQRPGCRDPGRPQGACYSAPNPACTHLRVQTNMAFPQVAAWRVRGRVPLGVDITASLLETALQDPQQSCVLFPHSTSSPLPSHGSMSQQLLRLQYSLTLVRCAVVAGLSAVHTVLHVLQHVDSVLLHEQQPQLAMAPPPHLGRGHVSIHSPACTTLCHSMHSMLPRVASCLAHSLTCQTTTPPLSPPYHRMVNGIADSQQRGKVAVSVASLADAAGLPRLLVDLRHDATHNELPALPTLHVALHQALGWLTANYW